MKKNMLAAGLMLSMLMLCLCACGKSEEKAAETTAEKAVLTEAPETEAGTEKAEAETAETSAAAAEEVQKDTEASQEETAGSQEETEAAAEPETQPDRTLRMTCTIISEGRTVGENYAGEARIRYPGFRLYEEDAEGFPKLQRAFENLNRRYETEYRARLEEACETAEEDLAGGSEMEISFFHELTPEVCRADSHIVSIREAYDMYMGGAHGYNAFYGDNFDPETGEELLLKDVVADMDAFRETVKEKLYEQYPGEEFGDLDEALADLDPAAGDASFWTMDYSGITLYFNPYHLAAYASGMQVITVPFNENPALFREKYLDVPETFAQALNVRVPAVLDVNGDGMNESLLVAEEIPEGEISEEGYDSGYRTWVITCGGESVKVSDYCYRAAFYLVRANDQYYVHVFEISDNDYPLFTAVDLGTMKNDAERTFNARLTMFDTKYNYEELEYHSEYTEDVYTDPERVYLSSRMEVLGTNTGTKLYGIAGDGWLKPDSEDFEVYTVMVYTARAELDCTEVDESGKELGGAVLEKGRYYHLVRTDGSTYADLQAYEDGEVAVSEGYPYVTGVEARGIDSTRPIYRLPYDGSDYPHTVSGMPEEEAFDGILYAG